MSDPDQTAKIQTIPRCKPRDAWEETVFALGQARHFAPASSIRESINQLLQEMAARREAA